MKDYYEILGVSENAESFEIRKAYSRLIRKFNPEAHPEEFSEIRTAYEVLGDEKLKREYDTNKKHGSEIYELLSVAEDFYNDEEYHKAIKYYKKALILNPNLYHASNSLSLCYFYNGQVEDAINILESTIKRCDSIPLLHFNCGFCYLSKENRLKAEQYFLKALEIEPINLTVIKELLNIYNNKNVRRYQDSIKILTKAIEYDEEETFQDFDFLFELAKVYTFMDNMNRFKEVIERIKQTAMDEEQRNYAAFQFGRFAESLYKAEIYGFARIYAEGALEFGASDKELVDILKELKKRSEDMDETYEMWEKLIKDNTIENVFKGPIYFYLFPDEEDEEKQEQEYKENINVLIQIVDKNPELLIESVEKIKNHYLMLYEYKSDLYSKLLQEAKKRQKLLSEFNSIRYDSTVIKPIVTIIAYWLDGNRDDRLFDSAVEDMGHYRIQSVGDSITQIMRKYSHLYHMNENFFDKLLNSCREGGYGQTTYYPQRKKSDCFITTAVCETLWKPDDCYELTAFRTFRDNWLKKQPYGSSLIEEYYKIAPDIVERINQNPNRNDIYRNIWNDYLSECLSLIKNGMMDNCRILYMRMVKALEKEFLPDKI